MKKIILISISTSLILFATNFTPCASCHGQNAEKKALASSEIISTWSEDRIIKALRGYKDGTYGGAMKNVMVGQVLRLSDKDIKNLAKKISSFK